MLLSDLNQLFIQSKFTENNLHLLLSYHHFLQFNFFRTKMSKQQWCRPLQCEQIIQLHPFCFKLNSQSRTYLEHDPLNSVMFYLYLFGHSFLITVRISKCYWCFCLTFRKDVTVNWMLLGFELLDKQIKFPTQPLTSLRSLLMMRQTDDLIWRKGGVVVCWSNQNNSDWLRKTRWWEQKWHCAVWQWFRVFSLPLAEKCEIAEK